MTSADGAKLVGVQVEVYQGPRGSGELHTVTTTQKGGTWQCRDLPLGTYFVKFVSPDPSRLASVWYSGSYSLDGAEEVVVAGSSPVRNIDGILHPAGTITGLVRETGSNNLLAGIEVGAHVQGESQLYLVGELATTGTDGRYTISGLPSDGEYYLIGTDPSGFHIAVFTGEPVTVNPNSPVTVDLWMAPRRSHHRQGHRTIG